MDSESIAVLVIAAVFGIMALFLFFIAYRQQKEKGVIFTNEWLLASKQERKKMDERIKKTEYRLGRNVFFMLGILCLVFMLYLLLSVEWVLLIFYAMIGCSVFYVIYLIVKKDRYYKSIGYRK